MKRRVLWGFIALLGITAGWMFVYRGPSSQMPPLPMPSRRAALVVAGARAQLGDSYDARYQTISYPGGDVKKGRGACTDVVVRAFRNAGLDLQENIHRDMTAHFADYPRLWGLQAPNTDIDHRRVPNQIAFLKRHAKTLTTVVAPWSLKQWQPGDIVYWDTGGRMRQRLHTGIVTNQRNGRGVPYVIHNGWRCIEEDALTRWKIIGHFRLDDKPVS